MHSNSQIQESFQESRDQFGQNQEQLINQEQKRSFFNQYNDQSNNNINNFRSNINNNNTIITRTLGLNNMNVVSVNSQSKIQKLPQRQDIHSQLNQHENISQKQSYYEKAFENQLQQEIQSKNIDFIQNNQNIIQNSYQGQNQQHPQQGQKINIPQNFSPILMKQLLQQNNKNLVNFKNNQQNNVILRNTITNVENINSKNIVQQNLSNNNVFLRHSLPSQNQQQIQQNIHMNQHLQRNQQQNNIPIVYGQNTQTLNQQYIKNKSSDLLKINLGHFIPLQLQKSQIVYTTVPHYVVLQNKSQYQQQHKQQQQNIQNKFNNKQVIQLTQKQSFPQLINNNQLPPIIHQQQILPQIPIRNNSHQRARSSSRSSTNVIFNYKVSENKPIIIQQAIRQKQHIPIKQIIIQKRQSISPPIQQVRSNSINKVIVIPQRQISQQKINSPVKILTQKSNQIIYKQQSKQLISKQHSNQLISKQQSKQLISKQHSNQLISKQQSKQLISKQHSNQLISKQQSKQLISKQHSNQIIQVSNNQWKQKYINLFTHITQINNSIINVNSFYNQNIYQYLINNNNIEQSFHNQLNKYNSQINKLQSYSNTVINDWKLQTQSKNNINQKPHIQIKYKRLLFNYSKLQQQNNFMKANFQKKIHQVVKKLQDQNKLLKNKIQNIKKQYIVKFESLNQQYNIKIQQFKNKSTKIQQKSPLKPTKQLQPQLTQNYQLQINKLNQQLFILKNFKKQIYDNFIQQQKNNQQLRKIIQQLEQHTNKLSITIKQKDIIIKSIKQTKQKNDLSQINIQNYQKCIHQLQTSNTAYITQNKFLKDQIQKLNDKINNQKKQIIILEQRLLQKQKPIKQHHDISILQQQFQFTISMLRTQIKRKDDQLQRQSKLYDHRISDLTEQLKISYQQRESIHKKCDQKISYIQKQKQKKQNIILQLRQQLIRLEQQISNNNNNNKKEYVNDYTSRVSLYTDNQQLIKYKHEIQILTTQKQKQKKQYQQQLFSLQQQNNQYKHDNMRLKKQISQFSNINNQVQNLTQIINKKNMEILQLKNVLFEREKLIIENNNLKRQIDRLLQDNNIINQQYQKVNKNYYQINRNLKQLQYNFNIINKKFIHLQSQYNILLQVNNRKDNQILKLRQSNQLLQTNIEELSIQLQKNKSKIKQLSSIFQRQRTPLLKQLQNLQQKLNNYENIIKQISVLQHKIVQLQSLKQKYQYQLKQNQQLITKQKNKIKTYQSQIQDLQIQLQSINNKFKQNQNKINQNQKKHKKIIQELQQKNKSLQQKQIKFQKQKINQLQSQIKNKQNKIWKLEKQIEQLQQRLDQVGDQQLYTQKIIVLQQKVKDYQSRLFNQAFKYNPTNYDYQATKVFQKKIIYQLKQENQKLKQLVNKKILMKPTQDKIKQNKSQIKQNNNNNQNKQQQDIDQVQNRLQIFNNRLQKLINPQSNPNKTPRNNTQKMLGISQVASNQYQFYAQDNIKTQFQLRQLKLKHKQLQKYCKNIQVALLSNNTQRTTSITSLNSHNDQYNYYKQKNRQLQQRVETLLKMNKQLKQNLQDLLKKQSENSINFVYKQNATELNQKNKNLQIKIKNILTQNQNLQSKLSNNIKIIQQFQSKIYELQRKLMQFQRLKNEKNIQKSSYQRQIQELKDYIRVKEQQINDLRNKLTLSSDKQSSVIFSLRQKIQTYDIEFIKLQNKLKVTQLQIQRFNQVIQRKQSQYIQQINKSRLKSNLLQDQLNRILSEGESQKNSSNTMKIQISKLIQQNKNANYTIQQLKQTNQNLLKKIQQSQNRYRQLTNKYYNLQNQFINIKRNEKQNMITIQHWQTQNSKLITKLRFIQQQIQRLTQNYNTKIRNYQYQINTLNGKIGLTQMQHMKLKNKSNSIQSQKQSYEADFMKQKNTISLLSSQVERLNQQLTKKQKYYQQKILNLKNILSTVQNQQIILNNQKQKYQVQINRLQSQIAVFTQENLRWGERIRQLQNANASTSQTQSSNILRLRQENQELKQNIQSLKQSFSSVVGKLQTKIKSLSYYIQLQRNIFLEIQALIDQKVYSNKNEKVQILETIGQEIQKGLKLISQINAIISIIN